jgi:hypothetical protein
MSPARFHLRSGLVLAAAVLGLAAAPVPAPAPPAAAVPAPSPAHGFDTFRPIGSLNIFDSTRSGPADDALRGDAVAVVGTVESQSGWAVLFDGSNAEFRQVLHVHDTIAGFTVMRIEENGVELQRDAQKLFVAVSQRLHRPPGGDWALDASTPAPARKARGAWPAGGRGSGSHRGGHRRPQSNQSESPPSSPQPNRP